MVTDARFKNDFASSFHQSIVSLVSGQSNPLSYFKIVILPELRQDKYRGKFTRP